MPSTALLRALTEGDGLRPLPDDATSLLLELDAPPRLAAHLRAVHQAAWELTEGLTRTFPKLEFDRDAVLFGAAIHDIGKTIHIAELSGPGSLHEQAGYQLLLDRGIEERLARFARTHAAWTEPTNQIEDLLVSLADKVWKAKRVEDLEQLVLDRIVAAHGRAAWEAFQHLDDLLDQIAANADDRLAFQSSYPV
jgi:HD superfamily phosphodiesterase